MHEPESITTIDCQYISPRQAAAYLVVDNGRACFVDNNTKHAVPILLEALEEKGIPRENVDYAIVTHIHLDHAGGTPDLIKACPNAKVLAHPRAVRHLLDPSRLVASATMVWGDEQFAAIFGGMDPIPEDRIQVMEDGETLDWESRTFTFTHALGHAKHHFYVHDSATNSVFAGDVFGLGYLDLQTGTRPYITVVCSPPEFDPEAWREAVRKLAASKPDRIYQTHFGVCTEVEAGAEQLIRTIDNMEAIVDEVANNDLEGDALYKFCEERVEKAIEAELKRCGVPRNADTEYYGKLEVFLNAQGCAYLGTKRRESA